MGKYAIKSIEKISFISEGKSVVDVKNIPDYKVVSKENFYRWVEKYSHNIKNKETKSWSPHSDTCFSKERYEDVYGNIIAFIYTSLSSYGEDVIYYINTELMNLGEKYKCLIKNETHIEGHGEILFEINNPKLCSFDITDEIIYHSGGVGKKTLCPECEEGTLEFIGCDDDLDISEMMYECNVCYMPNVIKLKGE